MDAYTAIKQLEHERIRLSTQPYVALTQADLDRLAAIRRQVLDLWPRARAERAQART